VGFSLPLTCDIANFAISRLGDLVRIFNLNLPLTPESDKMLTYDALRFLAASGIVLQHANSFMFPASLRTDLKEASFGLALLVDLFFLISGYVITYVYGAKITNFSDYFEFLQKRVARLWPLHMVTLIIFTMFYFAALAVGVKIGTMPDISVSCLVKTAIMLHAIVHCEGAPVNPVSWSISAEMVMYAVFPLIYLTLARNKWTATAGIVAATLSLAAMSWTLHAHEWTESYPLVRALPSFTFGVCLFRIVSQYPGPTAKQRPLMLFLLSASVLIMFYVMMNNGSALTILACICATCTFSAYIDRTTTTNAALRAAAGMGRLTYSIYMIHLLIVTVFVNVISDKLLKLSGWPMALVILATYLLVVCLSFATYSWIEMPLRRALSPSSVASKRAHNL
jgi:peptidoglycan/LPS O-acetylase OafA/YrhL